MDAFFNIKLPYKDNVLLKPSIGGSRASLHPRIIDTPSKYFKVIKAYPDWVQKDIIVGGVKLAERRKTCAFSNRAGLVYSYNGYDYKDTPEFPPEIEQIRQMVIEEIKDRTGEVYDFNFCMANLYRNNKDKISWHPDDETSMDPEAPIASVSLGSSRDFWCRESKNHSRKVKLFLNSGDMVVMWPPMQSHYEHTVPEKTSAIGARVNLTFRVVM